jgi:fatty-acyl-CoA synthase
MDDALHDGPFLPHLLIHALGHDLDRPTVHIGDRVLTAGEVRDEISRFAQAFAARGITKGTPVAVLSMNRPEVLYAMGANMVTGCRSTPLHPMGAVDDQAYVLADAGTEVLIFDPSLFADRARALQEKVPGLRHLLALGPTMVGDDLPAEAAAFEPKPLTPPPARPDEVSGIAYSGGTTGRPKGIQSTYRSAATMTTIQMAEWEWPEEVRHLVCTPLSHAGAAFFIPVLLRGGSIVVLPGFDPVKVMDAIQTYRITTLMLVPTMLYVLLDHPRLGEFDLSSLETVYYGASAISPTRLDEAIARFGPIFFQFYGQAECPMTITVLRKDEHRPGDLARLATCGRPVPWLRVALLDDDGGEVPDGEPGEICVRGPLVMGGYWNLPEQTAEAFAHGWLHTGDVARRDDEGFLTIVDRKKDMIVTGGFNVFPREVEDVLGTHDAVAQAAVIGVPDEKWGEAVTALVVLRPGATVTGDELAALVKAQKGSLHAPKQVEFVESIPLSPLGKPDKKAIRARYWDAAGRQIG